uniref:Bifunctional phosphoglucose/phosphomannose isomerase n=1 Tax=Staphylothermus marinus TaxID=2280 RepID=A0A7C4NN21_STAMA
MLEQYDRWIEQIKQALEKWGLYEIDGSFRTIVVSGMGGSGIVGDYIAVINDSYGGLPVLVYKTYETPAVLSGEDLVLAISYSGNTYETILFVKKSLERNARVVIVSSGGLLEKLSIENKLLFIKIPEGYVPRTSMPSMLINTLSLLSRSGLSKITRSDVEDTLNHLENTISKAKSIGEKLAEFIHSREGLVTITSHTPYQPLLIRGKNEFNENSKLHVRIEIIPECFHNDIVGWEKPFSRNNVSIVFKDPDNTVGTKLLEYLIDIYRENGVSVFEIDLSGPNILAKLIYGSLILGYASVYLAYLRKVDPLATHSIRKYKEFVDSNLKYWGV